MADDKFKINFLCKRMDNVPERGNLSDKDYLNILMDIHRKDIEKQRVDEFSLLTKVLEKLQKGVSLDSEESMCLIMHGIV